MPRPIHCLAGCEARECTTAVDAANFLISWLGLTPVGQIERLEILLEFAGCGVGIYEVIIGIVNGSISIPEAAYEIVRVCPEQLMNKTSGELLTSAGDIEEVLRRLLDPCGKIISN